jgi:hypothetical protein
VEGEALCELPRGPALPHGRVPKGKERVCLTSALTSLLQHYSQWLGNGSVHQHEENMVYVCGGVLFGFKEENAVCFSSMDRAAGHHVKHRKANSACCHLARKLSS